MARLIYPFQPNVIDSLPNDLVALYRDLESELLVGICSRIRATGEMNEVTLQNIRALRGHGIDLSEIEQAIQQTGRISSQRMNQLFSDVIARNQGYFSRLINMAGLTEPETLVNGSTLDAIQRQAQNGVLNLTRSMGFLVNGGQTMLQPAKAYQWALDQAMLKVQSGAWSYNDAIWDAVRQLADSGLKSVDYESGFVSALDVAVRRAIMTGVNQINQKYRDQSAEFLQTDLVEVTAHLGARNIKGPKGWEAHSEWQGKVYQKGKVTPGGKYPSFEKKCGYGDVQGIGGANCRHSYWPFVEGVSERTYTDDELEKMKPENRPKIQYDGKEYDDYQATQAQRRLENAYRKTKRRELAANAVGDEKHAAAARARRIALSRKYSDFSAAAGLPEQRERMKVHWPQGQQAQGGSGGTTPKPAQTLFMPTVVPSKNAPRNTGLQNVPDGGIMRANTVGQADEKEIQSYAEKQAKKKAAFANFVNYVRETFGKEFLIGSGIESLDAQSMTEALDGMRDALNEFGVPLSYVRGIKIMPADLLKVSKDKIAPLAVTPDGYVLFNPQIYINRKFAVSAINDNSGTRELHPPGYSTKTIGYHEACHIIENYLIDRRAGWDSARKYTLYNDGIISRKIVNAAASSLKIDPNDIKAIKRAKSTICKYSKRNSSECIAEALFDVLQNQDKAASFSTAIVDVIRKELNNVNGKRR